MCGGQERGLAREVPVGGGARDARVLGRFLDSGRQAPGDEVPRRVDQRLTSALLLLDATVLFVRG